MAVHVARLAHVAIGSDGFDELDAFYAEMFGVVEVARHGPLRFLSGGRGFAYDVVLGPWPAGMDHFAFAVAERDSLQEARNRLDLGGVEFEPVDLDEEHGIVDGIRFVLPSGHVMELVLPAAGEVFQPRSQVAAVHHRGIGPVALEHVTMTCGDVRSTAAFLSEHLDFRLSESVQPAPGEWFNAFIRCRDRHHDLAFFENPDGDVPGLDHFAFAVPSAHELLRAADLLASFGIALDASMGRHVSGNSVFIYFNDGSGVRHEVNTDIAEIDPTASPRIGRESIFDAWRPGIPPALLSYSRCHDGRHAGSEVT
jgi:catechol 2,3-dioxygenase